ncbi:hypothetical protein D0T53_11030 [Dysgonomonas sp. 216]|uniref:hypothetical protein n=1 Tax=Dysgonomonas sp. 216 TaxID=2302934 RepID=UPI0013D301D2|nr:hypothetical protein [Dysgonomonas sp. 216]NDW19438.1 hypothetical protein [Dysgonomonas sp. 216]
MKVLAMQHIINCDTTREEMQAIVEAVEKHLYNPISEDWDFDDTVLGFPVYVDFAGHGETLYVKEVTVQDRIHHYSMDRDSFALKCTLEDTIMPVFTKYAKERRIQQEQIKEDQSLTQFGMGIYTHY